jgi:P27 family predicted phage terminase small subunit
MAKRGPKKLPSELRLLRGGKSVNPHRPITTGKPVSPAELTAEAKVVWKRLLASMPPGLYGRADVGTLAAYCTAEAEFLQAAQTVQAEGRVLTDRYDRRYANPAFRQMADAARLIVSLGNVLGLSPTARDGLRAPDATEDTWEGLLR